MESRSLKERSKQVFLNRWAYSHVDGCVRVLVVVALLGVLLYPRPPPHRAFMQPIEVLDETPDPCAAIVGGSKVALLFLTRGEIHHEDMWRLWLRSAAGYLPLRVGAPALCSLDDYDLAIARRVCSADSNKTLESHSNSVLDDAFANQHLFNIYVHVAENIDDDTLGPLFRPHVISHRVSTEWGTHSLVEAARHLLWEAFRDPSNQRFVLISESDIPLWDPVTFYRELMAEQRSWVDGWWHPDMDVERWSWRMALSGARIKSTDWRKSAQWFSLIRSHAEVALQDTVVFSAFQDNCHSAWDSDMGRFRDCYSDEHYLPTLLYLKGVQEETIPSPHGVTAADWSEGNPHPHEYVPEEITPALFTSKLRNTSYCPSTPKEHAAAQTQARQWVATARDALDQGLATRCGEVNDENASEEGIGEPLLGSGCSLLARKFPMASKQAVLELFSNCENGLALLSNDACGPPSDRATATAK